MLQCAALLKIPHYGNWIRWHREMFSLRAVHFAVTPNLNTTHQHDAEEAVVEEEPDECVQQEDCEAGEARQVVHSPRQQRPADDALRQRLQHDQVG